MYLSIKKLLSCLKLGQNVEDSIEGFFLLMELINDVKE